MAKLESQHNPDWYRIKYQIAALHLNWSVDPSETAPEGFAQLAIEQATELARTTMTTLARLTGDRPRSRGDGFLHETLTPFLEGTIAPSVLILVASTIVDPESRPPEGWREHRRTMPEIRDLLGAGEVDPWALIAYVDCGSNRSPITRFNLACFYARANDLTTAARRLHSAVRETPRPERAALIEVARNDPVLEPLRRKRRGIVAKLIRLDPNLKPTPAEEAAERHFDLQERVRKSLETEGWRVEWADVESRFDLWASRPGEWLLVELLDGDGDGDCRLSDNHIEGTIGGLRTFRRDGVDMNTVSVSARIIAPDSCRDADVDRDRASSEGVEVHLEPLQRLPASA